MENFRFRLVRKIFTGVFVLVAFDVVLTLWMLYAQFRFVVVLYKITDMQKIPQPSE